MDIKIAIAIVSNRQIKPKTVLSLMDMLAFTTYPTHAIMATEGYTIAEGRAYCVIQAQKNNCTHILFVDDDMIFPSDTLEKLVAHKKDIIGVNSQSRALPLSTTVSILVDGEHVPHANLSPLYKMPEELFEVFSVGMGVALIDMEVFEKIEKPYFHFETHESGKIIIGEDAWMCKQAREKNIKIWCDPTIPIGHLGEYNYAL